MLTLLLIVTTALWASVIISQGVAVALIAALSSTFNVWLAARIHIQTKDNAKRLDETSNEIRAVKDAKRIVITHTDRGLIITDEDDPRELEPRPGTAP